MTSPRPRGYRELPPILDADGNRIGVLTADGPVYSASPEDLADIEDAKRRSLESELGDLRRISTAARKQKMAELRDLADVAPRMLVHEISELTGDERRIIQAALQQHDVNLPYAASFLKKFREHRLGSRAAAAKAAERAAKRLYNRGLATVEKRADGLNWVHVDEGRLRALIRSDVISKRPSGADDVYLMRGTCETQTFGSGPRRGSKRRTDPAALPRNASGERLEACRMLTGVKMLDGDDRADLMWRFRSYLDGTTQKIIALLNSASGEAFGCEYSTRFNDIAKVARSLNKFDYMMDRSFERHWRAVFLTLTTDPNLTDGEAAAQREARLAEAEAKLRIADLSPKARRRWQARYWQLMGPDAEIEELERRAAAATATAGDARRLHALRADLEKSKGMLEKLADPRTGVRTRENLIHGLKRMNRWRDDYDPEGFQSLWEANRSFSKNWNNFLAFVRKRLGASPEHIPAYEFTESGLLHVHAIILVPYLMDINDIVKEWRRLGQGQVADIYTLRAVPRRDGSGGWEWRWNARSRPDGAKGMSGGDYLKKYVKKAMLALMDGYTSPAAIQSLYWAFNKRFFTGSPSLAEGFDAEKAAREPAAAVSPWGLWRIMSADEASDMGLEIRYHRIVPAAQRERERERRLLGAIG